MIELERRTILKGAAGAVLIAAGTPLSAATEAVGKPGDFDFLTGEWRIHNRMIKPGTKADWIEFPGEATVYRILDGVGSVEELRIPARQFSGMGLRLLDVEKRIWNDHWVNAKSGVVVVPGQQGVFRDGVGTFTSDETVDGVHYIYRGVWDEITPSSCRWSQGMSTDEGKTWADSWYMRWTRVK